MKQKLIFFFIVSLVVITNAFAQHPKPKIAILAPLYLDSAFDSYSYQLGEKPIPSYILNGLDFYNGAMLAVDALQKENTGVEVWVYDTKKAGTNINAILKGMTTLDFSLIIASLNNTDEQKAISEFSFSNNIPVVSATYPNDANIADNPFFVLLNSTLKTHIDGIYRYAVQNYNAAGRLLFITRNAPLENRILADFKQNDSATVRRLKYKTLSLISDDIGIENLAPYLDSTKTNVVICGSLSIALGVNIAKALCDNPQYKTTLIGMPNWDGVHQLNKLDCNNLDIIYSTPYNYSRTDSIGYSISQAYRAKYYLRPTDMVYKGYEAMYHFTHLLLNYKNELIGHFSDSTYAVSTSFNIKPVMLPDSSFIPAYQENQNLYFIKKTSGQITSVSTLLR